jgi:hypothetical protein
MPTLSSSRGRLDSIVYWSAFILVSCFITYFLNSMIAMAGDEEYRYQDSIRTENAAVRAHAKAMHAKAEYREDDGAEADEDDY